MTAIEKDVLNAFRDNYPEPALAGDIQCQIQKPPPRAVIAAVIQALYGAGYLICRDGGFVVTKPRRFRTIDAEWA